MKKGIVILGLMGFLIFVVMISGCTSNDNSNNTTANQNVSAEDLAKSQKMTEIEQTSAFKNAANSFIKEMYPESSYKANISSVIIMNMTSENEVSVDLVVDWTTIYGDRVSDTYWGTWIKENGIWKPQDNFVKHYTEKDGKIYNPGESLY